MDFNKKALIIIIIGLLFSMVPSLYFPVHAHSHKLPFYYILIIFFINSFIFSISIILFSNEMKYLILLWIFINVVFESFIAFSTIEIINYKIGITTISLILTEMSILILFCKNGFKSINYIIGETFYFILAVLEVFIYNLVI